jgi:hypothetical protein
MPANPTTTYASPLHEQAENTKTEFQRRADTIRADNRLTPQGKQQAIAKLYTSTRATLDALGTTHDTGRATRRATLERNLFGLKAGALSTDTISYRDAMDRVSSVKDEADLAPILRTANLSGDTILGKAVLARAFELGEVGTINQYIEATPALEKDVVELWGLSAPDDFQSMFDDTMFAVQKPTEIAALSDSAINGMASPEG